MNPFNDAEPRGHTCLMQFRSLALVLLGLWSPPEALAQQGPRTPTGAPVTNHPELTMTFTNGYGGGNHAASEWIVADGPITRTTPADFRRYIQGLGSSANVRYTIILNSPGGDLTAGLELGMLIREGRYDTSIGRTVTSRYSRENPSALHTQEVVAGTCVSACAYAFLGGVDRSAAPGEIGFHQFYSPRALQDARAQQFSATDLSATQATVGLIALYLKEMGIDPEVIFIASNQSPGGMAYPTRADLRRLRISNVSLEPIIEPWTIEPVGRGAIVTNRLRLNSRREERIALHCRRSSPDTIVLRGAWTFGVAEGPIIARPGSGALATSQLRAAISSTALVIGRTEVRRHPGMTGLLDARVDDDGTYRIAFVMTMAEFRRGLAEGFEVVVDLPRSLDVEARFKPPLPGLAERMAIALRSCV